MEEESHDKNTENPIIKHIVISGGGIAGFSFYGALRESSKQNIWNIDNIQSIYGTSVGSMLAVILCLKYDWDTIDDYLIKRPWQNLYKFNIYSMLEAMQKRGIFDVNLIEETLLPLFSGKDLSIDITMAEFYEKTNIDLHVFSTEIHSFTIVDISHKTHPHWKVTDAIYSSSSLPVLFSPYLIDDKCYCDGGMIINYPISACIENGCNPAEILGINRIRDDAQISGITNESSLIDYSMIILERSLEKIRSPSIDKKIGVEYNIKSQRLSLFDILNTAASMEERIRLIEIGAGNLREGEP